MNKTPDEIKKGLSMCTHGADCGHCPYTLLECSHNQMEQDALAYIRHLEAANVEVLNLCKQLEAKCHQLERERDALMHWAKGRCDTCAYNDDCVKHDPDPEGLIVHWYDDCESWEWCGVKEE